MSHAKRLKFSLVGGINDMGIDSIEHANISSLLMGQDTPLLRLHHDHNTVLVT
jgi:hypothetical protein